jgi:signal transduction histidine kinase
MELSLPTAIVNAAIGNAVLASLLTYLRLRPGMPAGLGWWAAAFWLQTARYIGFLAEPGLGHSASLILADSLHGTAAVFLLAGTAEFVERGRNRKWIWLASAGVTAFVAGAVLSDAGFLVRTIPQYTLSGLANLAAGVLLLRNMPEKSRIGYRLAAGSLIVWGLHKFDYPILRPVEWFAPYGFMLAYVLSLTLALGLVMMAQTALAAAVEREAMQRRRAQESYRQLIEHAEIAIWDENLTGLKGTFERLRGEGVTDLRQYMETHPELLDEIRLGVWVNDVNPAALRLYKASDKKDLMAALEKIWWEMDRQGLVDAVATVWEGKEAYHGTVRQHTLNGEMLEVVMSVPRLGPENSWENVPVTMLDVTELKNAERELRRAKDGAETANRAKSEFLASMSHDLRTPLNAVLGFAQMLQLETSAPLTEAQRAQVDHIIVGGTHLMELINDILDLAKIEAEQLDLVMETVDAAAVVAECISLSAPLARAEKVSIENRFSGRGEVWLNTDPVRFTQVLLNLLSNAVKYNKAGGKVSVDGEVRANGTLRLEITDTGIGISEADRPRIFQMFQRFGTSATLAREGTGIGLSVSKLLVERMGGSIGFESETGVGSTFWIELPLEAAEEGAAREKN